MRLPGTVGPFTSRSREQAFSSATHEQVIPRRLEVSAYQRPISPLSIPRNVRACMGPVLLSHPSALYDIKFFSSRSLPHLPPVLFKYSLRTGLSTSCPDLLCLSQFQVRVLPLTYSDSSPDLTWSKGSWKERTLPAATLLAPPPSVSENGFPGQQSDGSLLSEG